MPWCRFRVGRRSRDGTDLRKWNADLRAIIGEQPRIALAGVSTDCCVIATALPAADAGAQVRVLADCCAGSTPENHAQAIGAMSLFGPQSPSIAGWQAGTVDTALLSRPSAGSSRS
jgi:hypothetical protein